MTDLSNTPELATLLKVIERLEKDSIPYLLTGSMALNFYGHPRASNDFDIVVALQTRDAERVISLFQEDFYINEQAVHEAIAQNKMFNIIDNEAVFKVDLIVKKNTPYAEEQFKRRRKMSFAGFETSVISPEDLVLAKLDWSRESGSEMQDRDVRGLIRLLGDKLDRPYMEKWAAVLDLSDQLRRYYAPA